MQQQYNQMASIDHYELPPPPPYPHYIHSQDNGNQCNYSSNNLSLHFQNEEQPEYPLSLLPIPPISPQTSAPHHIEVQPARLECTIANLFQNSQVQPNQIHPLPHHHQLPPPPPYPYHLLFRGYGKPENYPQSLDNHHNNSTPSNNYYDLHRHAQNQEQQPSDFTSPIAALSTQTNVLRHIDINSESPACNWNATQELAQSHPLAINFHVLQSQSHGGYGQPNNNNNGLSLPPPNQEPSAYSLLAPTITSYPEDINYGQDIYINSAIQEGSHFQMQQEFDQTYPNYQNIMPPPPPYRPPPPPYPQQEVQVDHWSKGQFNNSNNDVPLHFENQQESLYSASALPITPPVANVPHDKHINLETQSLTMEPPINETRDDIEELAQFAKTFKQKRIKLGFSQKDVRFAIRNQYRCKVSQAYVSRFETLKLSFKKMCNLKLILQKWLDDKQKARRNPIDGRRRKRVAAKTHKLANYFKQNSHPRREEIAVISENLGMDRKVVRVWFSSRHSKETQKTKVGLCCIPPSAK